MPTQVEQAQGTQGTQEIAPEKTIEDSLTWTYPVSEKLAADIKNRFTHHAPQSDQTPRYALLRKQALLLAQMIIRYTPPSREQALALTKLEETVMHANSAIAREPRPVSEG